MRILVYSCGYHAGMQFRVLGDVMPESKNHYHYVPCELRGGLFPACILIPALHRTTLLVLLLLAFGLHAAPAAPITWGSATTISAPTDVSTTGTLIEANNLTNGFFYNPATVNGVHFNAIDLGSVVGFSQGNLTITGIGVAQTFSTTAVTPYDVILAQGVGTNGTTLTPMTISLAGLTVGDGYSFQFWDQSGGSVTATAGNTVTLNGSGAGQFALGSFTADSTTQSISFLGPLTFFAEINAFQFRLTALPATDWLGQTDSTWTGTNWASDAAGTATTAIPAGTDVTFSATGAPNAAKNTTLGADFTIHSLTIQDSNAVTIGGANTLTISGAAGTGINVQSGAGLFTMNANLVLGGSSDTITVNNASGSVINGTIAANNGLTVNGTGALTLNGAISGTNGLTMNGTGTLTLNAVETFTGGTTVQGGTLQVGDGAKAAALVAATGSSTPNGTGGTGGTSVTVFNAATVKILANATVTGGTGGHATLGTGGDGGTGLIFMDGGVLTSNGTINGGTSGGGPTSGNGGTGVNFFNGGTFTNTGSVSGGSTASLTNTAQTGGIGVWFSGGGGVLTNSGTIVGGAGTNGVFAGGSGGAGVLFSGFNALTNSLTNSGTISGGALGTGGLSSGTVGTGVVFSHVPGTLDNKNHGIINNGVSMDNYTDGFNYFPNTVTLEIGSKINGALNINTNTASTLTLTDDGSGGTQSYSTAVTGATTFAGALTKAGTGTWTLDQTFNYSGATTINDGTLQVGIDNALPAGTTVTINDPTGNGTALLDVNGHAQTIAGLTFVAPKGGGSSTVDVNGGVLTLGGNVSVVDNTSAPGNGGNSVINDIAGGGALDLGGATRTFTIAGQNLLQNDLIINAKIQGAGGVVINASPSTFNSSEGGVFFGAANTYTGSTTVAQGRLTTTVAGAVPSTTDLILGTAASALTGDVDLDGTSQTVNSLALAAGNTGGTGNFITSNGGASTLTVSSTTTSSTFGGLITGPLSLVKAGAGTTLTLTGTNTYTGTTTINAGTLAINGNNSAGRLAQPASEPAGPGSGCSSGRPPGAKCCRRRPA